MCRKGRFSDIPKWPVFRCVKKAGVQMCEDRCSDVRKRSVFKCVEKIGVQMCERGRCSDVWKRPVFRKAEDKKWRWHEWTTFAFETGLFV